MNKRIALSILLALAMSVACQKVKYADKYGFLPENDAVTNSEALQECLDDPENGTTGFFARILAGGWRDWEEVMDIQSSGDAVVSGGRIYRSYYLYAEIPVQSNIVFERVSVENEIPVLIQSRTPVDSILAEPAVPGLLD